MVDDSDDDDNDDDDNEDNTPPAFVAAVALSGSEPTIPFILGGKEAMTTVAGYAKIAFAFFAWGSIIILFHRSI